MIINENFTIDKNKKNVLYVDANNLASRAYYAAIAGNKNPLEVLLGMAYKLKTKVKNDFSFAIYDGKNNKETRLEIYKEYKASRKEKTEEEIRFMENSPEVFKSLGYTVYNSNKIEADDVVGILSVRSANKGFNVIAVSSDKDYAQLCQYSPYINIYDSKKDTVLNQSNFNDNIPFNINYFVDYLSLVGDAADNINGVNKVGKKTAEKWLNEIGSIEDIKNNLDKIKDGSVKENLINAINTGLLDRNYKLIKFHFEHDNTITLSKEDMIPNKINYKKLDMYCILNNINSFVTNEIEKEVRNGLYIRDEEVNNLIKSNNTNQVIYKKNKF